MRIDDPVLKHVALFCLMALTLTGCGRGSDDARPERSKITVLYDGDEWVLGPSWGDDAQHLVFLSLVEGYVPGSEKGRLAEKWEHSPDYRQWTFYLRRDVTWHDGVPVTARDVEFCLELFARPGVLANNDLWRNLESIVVHDDFSFTVTYPEPTNALDGWGVFYPKHLLEELDPAEFRRWEFWTHPVGNGPYRYVRHVPKTMIELEANPDFYKGEPRIEQVVLKFAAGPPLVELLSGNVDAINYLNLADVPRLREDPRFRVHQTTGYSWILGTIFWNQQSSLFQDAAVRRALTLAIDRRELHQVLNLPVDLPVFDVISSARQFAEARFGERLPHDPVRARQQLDAAGWRDEDGNGIRERGGRELRFTAIVPAAGPASSTFYPAAIYVQEQLRHVGIRMDLETLSNSVMRHRVRDGEFEAAFMWLSNYPDPLLPLFGAQSPIGYHNPSLVELLEAARITMDPDAKDEIYRELREIFRRDVPFTMLFPTVYTFVAQRRVRGLEEILRFGSFIENIEYFWLDDSN